MYFRSLTAGLLSVLYATGAAAQVDLVASLEHRCYLLFEPIEVQLGIRNDSGTPVTLGPEGEAEVVLDVRDERGALAARLEECPVVRGTIAPGSNLVQRVNLLRCYDLRTPGAYTLRVLLVGPRETIRRGPIFFDVRRGTEEGSVQVEVPGEKEIIYRLFSLTRDGARCLLLRLERPEPAEALGVVDFGRVLRFYRPRLRADKMGRAHIVYQSGDTIPPVFVHAVVGPTG
ncbi:MAG TPA: hypothetical protein ENG36_02460, partial [Lentisphaerae bacterium]|nr:hypothetical protein [Lentisphaerota bacterium]